MSYNEEFEKVDAGSADCVPKQAGSIKKGGHCMLKGFPCKVIDFCTAKPGKHGSAKASIVGTDIFTGKKYEDSMPTSANVMVPIISKTQYEVADIDDENFVSLIQENGALKSDLKLPGDEELREDLKNCWQLNKEKGGQIYFTVIKAIKQEKIISGRFKQ